MMYINLPVLAVLWQIMGSDGEPEVSVRYPRYNPVTTDGSSMSFHVVAPSYTQAPL